MSDSVSITLALVLIGLLALSRLRAAWRSHRSRARLRRAREGERSARALLVRHGFRVDAEQAPGMLVLDVDGARSEHAVRADYLVSRDGKRFVAEVKTGAVAPSLDHAPTRRQILEYCAAFDVDGALLVDADAGSVRAIGLLTRKTRDWTALTMALVIGALIGLALASMR